MTRARDSQQQPQQKLTINKKRTCRIVGFDVTADQWVKLTESEKERKIHEP